MLDFRERIGDRVRIIRLPSRYSFGGITVYYRAGTLSCHSVYRRRQRQSGHAARHRLPLNGSGASSRQRAFRESPCPPSSSTRNASTSAATSRPIRRLNCCMIHRDSSDLTGTKYGCGMGSVALARFISKASQYAPARCHCRDQAGRGHHDDRGIEEQRKALQATWQKLDVPQCGYCQSGQIMTAAALLAKNRHPRRRRHRRGDGRQHLPLCHLRAHPRRHQGSRQQPGRVRRPTMNPMRMRPRLGSARPAEHS